jgi:hypothetical protein
MSMIYTGPNPQTIGKTRKYHVKLDNTIALDWDVPGKSEIRLLLTTEQHPDLVDMVNTIKRHGQNTDGGAFYINEHSQVIVPAGYPVRYYLAGTYVNQLRFWWENEIISGDARGFDGKSLRAGDPWTGPLVGIPYVFAAGGNDVYYTVEISPGAVQRIYLTDVTDNAEPTLSVVRAIIGNQGGRFYVNEYSEMFRPSGGNGPATYIARLDSRLPWFPKPHS